MAPKHTAKYAASSRPRRRILARLSPTALWRTWLVIGWSVTIVLTVWALKHLGGYVQASGPDVPCHLEWVELPPWLSELAFADGRPVLETIAAKANLCADDDIQAPDLCTRVAHGLQASAWVSEVHEVSAQRDGTIRVQASFRKPLAFVAVDGWAYLVDDMGVRLPPETSADFVPAGNWFLVTGVSEPVPEVSRPWTGSCAATSDASTRFATACSAMSRMPGISRRMPWSRSSATYSPTTGGLPSRRGRSGSR